MKKKNYFYSVFAIMMAAVMSVGFTACGGDDGGSTPPPTPSLKVNGVTSTSLTYEGAFKGKSGIDFKQSVNITSNVSWSVSGVPSWLSVSPTNGSGDLQLTIYPQNENLSSEARNATITVSGDGVSATIEVSQGAIYSKAKTTPTNILVMCYGVAMDFSCNQDVAYYDYAIMRNTEIVKYSDTELAEYLKSSSISDRKTPDDDWIVSTTSLSTTDTKGIDYTIVTVSYNKNGEQGEVVKVPFTTKPVSNAPEVWANHLSAAEDNSNNYYLIWDMEGNTYINKYYTWTVLAKKSFLTFVKGDYLVGWFIYKEIKNNSNSHNTTVNNQRGYNTSYERLEGPQLKIGEKVGSAPFDLETNYIQIVSWATDQNNELSGVLSNWTIDLTSSSAPRRANVLHNPLKKLQNDGQIIYQGVSKKALYENLSIQSAK